MAAQGTEGSVTERGTKRRHSEAEQDVVIGTDSEFLAKMDDGSVDGRVPAMENSEAEERTTRTSRLDYRNKEILAPMVRGSNLALRLQCLEYGCDIVYSEEVIAQKIVKATRKYNSFLDCVDFVKEMGGGKTEVVYRTNKEEEGKNVFQMGTPNAAFAVEAAKLVEQDVAAIDINMGCPKHFSVSGGMGAALLSKPEIAEDIVKSLKRNISIPVTCKIRLLQTDEETAELARRLWSAGADAVTIHGRTKEMRPHQKALWDRLNSVSEKLPPDFCPLILNGDIYSRDDMAKIKEQVPRASSIMVARGALINPSIFRKEGMLEKEEAVREYVRKCVKYGETYQNMKYVMMQYMVDTKTEKQRADRIVRSKSHRDICAAVDDSLVPFHDAFAKGPTYPKFEWSDEFPDCYKLK